MPPRGSFEYQGEQKSPISKYEVIKNKDGILDPWDDDDALAQEQMQALERGEIPHEIIASFEESREGEDDATVH